MSFLAQQLLNLQLRCPPRDLPRRFLASILNKIRLLFIRIIGDPLVQYPLLGKTLTLHLSHDLPLYRLHHPLYALNLADVAAYVQHQYPQMTVIDVGSNVGDSVLIVRSKIENPILCIEGEASYFELLTQNTTSLPAVERVNSFLYTQNGTINANVISENGTAALNPQENGKKLAVETMSEILNLYPRFESAKLIKIDTDGMDILILRSLLDWLRIAKPVVFFEYYPRAFMPFTPDGFQIFDLLRSVGYQHTIVYRNTGDYLLSVELSQTSLLADIGRTFADNQQYPYCDLCVFHSEDEAIFQALRQHYPSPTAGQERTDWRLDSP